jgi:purine-binding chemotaxis protein CheW
MKVLIFRVSHCRCCLMTTQVQEVTPMALLSQPPGLPPVIAGILNLGGQSVPVVRMDRLFGLPANPLDLSTALVILRCDPPLALMVDEVVNVREIPPDSDMALASGTTLNDCATGAWDDGRGIVHILSAERLLIEEEHARLEELHEQRQDRVNAMAQSAAL